MVIQRSLKLESLLRRCEFIIESFVNFKSDHFSFIECWNDNEGSTTVQLSLRLYMLPGPYSWYSSR